MDLNTTAFHIVKALTEEKTEAVAKRAAKGRAGRVGGAARAKALTDSRRAEIALAGSKARWAKKVNEY